VTPVSRPDVKLPKNFDPYWLAGFVSGEGCFMVKCMKSRSHKSGVQVILRFQITQHVRDVELIKSLVPYLNSGRYLSTEGRD
jgi:hypothetical protein